MQTTGQVTQNSVIRPVVPPGTNHNQLILLNRVPFANSGVSQAALTGTAHLLALPTTDSNRTTGQWIVTPILSLASIRRLMVVIGHATSAASLSFTMRLFGIKELVCAEAPTLNPTGGQGGQVVEYMRQPLLDLTWATSATAQAVADGSRFLIDPAGTYKDLRICDSASVVADYTLRAQAANMQMRSGAGLPFDQLLDGDGAVQMALSVKAPASAGVWCILGSL